MRSALSCWCLLAALAACAAGRPLAAEIVDGIVATVDTEIILRSELVAEIAPLLDSLRANAASSQALQGEVDKAMREALDQAIERKILYREALLAGLTIEDKAVEERLNKIRENYETSEEFLKVLEDAGETLSSFRDGLRKQILALSMARRKQKEFEEQAVVTESEMAQYYQDHASDFERPERVRLRRVFLPSDDAEARSKDSARLAALRQEAELGADFAELAKAHSKGPDADQGGLVGWVQRGDLVPELEEIVFALPEGGLSDVVETEFGCLLFKVEQKEAAGAASYEEARTEIEPLLRRNYAEERYQRWMGELRKHSRVRVFI